MTAVPDESSAVGMRGSEDGDCVSARPFAPGRPATFNELYPEGPTPLIVHSHPNVRVLTASVGEPKLLGLVRRYAVPAAGMAGRAATDVDTAADFGVRPARPLFGGARYLQDVPS